MLRLMQTFRGCLLILARSAFAVLIYGTGSACSAALYWEVNPAKLAVSGATVTLRGTDKVVAILPTSQLKKLHEVKERIGAAAGLQYVVLAISDQQEPNAFAGSAEGRRVIAFTLGMLRLVGEDEGLMAAVMGHEFGHHVRGHDGRETRQAAATVVGFLAGLVAGRAVADRLAADLTARALDLAGRAVIHAYDRDQEREADAFGIEVMARAGYDPQSAVRYWGAIANQASGGIFTTHPATSERMQNVQALAQQHARSTSSKISETIPVAPPSPSVVYTAPQSSAAQSPAPPAAVALVTTPARPRAPDAKLVERIFACLAQGLPQDWDKTWIVVTNLGAAQSEERQFEAQFFFTTPSGEERGEPLTPCNSKGLLLQVHDMNDLLAPEKRNWGLTIVKDYVRKVRLRLRSGARHDATPRGAVYRRGSRVNAP